MAFLELTEDAGPAEIKARLAERLAYFTDLSENAASDFLRRLNMRHLDKVKTILQESARWPSFTPAAEPAGSPEAVAVEEEALTMHIVSSLKDAVKKKAANEPVAWLIRHMENQPAHSFPVLTGTNFIGRKKHPSLAPFIVIEGDDFISRLQCVVYAVEGNPFLFYISDPSAFNNGKTSSNGSFINGHPVAVTTKQVLNNGDTLQLGITKLVFRLHTASLEKLQQEVAQTAYTNTVVIG